MGKVLGDGLALTSSIRLIQHLKAHTCGTIEKSTRVETGGYTGTFTNNNLHTYRIPIADFYTYMGELGLGVLGLVY